MNRAAKRAPALSAALAAVALTVCGIAGCTRSRHTGDLTMAPTSSATGRSPGADAAPSDAVASGAAAANASAEPIRSPHFDIDRPLRGASVTSPVRVSGVIRPQDGLIYVAQVVVLAALPVQRGNSRIALGADGAFSVDVPYVLDAPVDGTVEIAAVDPVSGTVAETVSVPVRLAAAR